MRLQQGRTADAEPLLVEAVRGCEKAFGSDHPDALRAVQLLGEANHWLGRYDRAEPLLARALARRDAVIGANHVETLIAVVTLARLYDATGREAAAVPLWRRAVAGFAGQEPRDFYAYEARCRDGEILLAEKKYAEAEPLLRNGYEGLAERNGGCISSAPWPRSW
jgi:tetratricopeptide (TPR) repeat protein